MTQPPEPGNRGIVELVFDIVAGLFRIGQGEIALARSEASLAMQRAKRAFVMFAAAVLLGLVGLIVLAGAAVAGLVALGLAPVWAAAIVGGGLLLLSLGCVQHGQWLLRQVRKAPARSRASLARDIEAFRSGVQGHADRGRGDGPDPEDRDAA